MTATATKLPLAGRAKDRAIAALRERRAKDHAIFQHHALHINRDGVELLPHKWYWYSYTDMLPIGPFDSMEDAYKNLCGRVN